MSTETEVSNEETEMRTFFASFGTNQSQRHAFLNAMRAYIVEILQCGVMDARVIHAVIGEVTNRLSWNGLLQILWANAENAWIEEDGFWRLNPNSFLVSGVIPGTRWDERLKTMMIRKILNGMVQRGELKRNGPSGKYGQLLTH